MNNGCYSTDITAANIFLSLFFTAELWAQRAWIQANSFYAGIKIKKLNTSDRIS